LPGAAPGAENNRLQLPNNASGTHFDEAQSIAELRNRGRTTLFSVCT